MVCRLFASSGFTCWDYRECFFEPTSISVKVSTETWMDEIKPIFTVKLEFGNRTEAIFSALFEFIGQSRPWCHEQNWHYFKDWFPKTWKLSIDKLIKIKFALVENLKLDCGDESVLLALFELFRHSGFSIIKKTVSFSGDCCPLSWKLSNHVKEF